MPHRVWEVLHSGSKTKCKDLASLGLAEEIICQAECLALDGAEPVRDGEELARIFEDPLHIDMANIRVRSSIICTPAAFADMYNKGLSVQRLNMTSLESVERFGSERSAEKGRRFLGVATSSAEKLRSARLDQASPRLLSVFATPLPELGAHADICVHVRPSKLVKEYLKFHLW